MSTLLVIAGFAMSLASVHFAHGESCSTLPKVRFAHPAVYQPESKRYRPNEYVPYACRTGFKFDPDNYNRVTCHQNGTWSRAPSCVAIACRWRGTQPEGGLFMVRRAVQSPGDGRMVLENLFVQASRNATYQFSSVATLTCQIGFVLSDIRATSTRCDADGQWRQPFPTCKRTLCTIAISAYPPNSLVAGSGWPGTLVPYGGAVRFRCLQGFHVGGVAGAVQEQTCMEEGRWSDVRPCERVRCGRAPSPNNALLLNAKPAFVFGEFANYQCEAGFRFSVPGSSTRSGSFCNAMGQWSATAPCVPLLCPAPGSPADGRVQTERHPATVGTTANYTCQPGFLLLGTAERLCTTQAQWTGTAPTCQDCSVVGTYPEQGDSNDRSPRPRRVLPWQVALWKKRPTGGEPNVVCTGALVHKRMVAMAAHCFEGISEHELRSGQVVVRYSSMTAEHERHVWRVYLHPEFEARTMTHNVAVLSLQKKIPSELEVTVVSLPEAETATAQCLESRYGRKILLGLSQVVAGREVQQETAEAATEESSACPSGPGAESQLCLRATGQNTRRYEGRLVAAHNGRQGARSQWTLIGLANRRTFRHSPTRISITKVSLHQQWISDKVACEQQTGKEKLSTRCACQA